MNIKLFSYISVSIILGLTAGCGGGGSSDSGNNIVGGTPTNPTPTNPTPTNPTPTNPTPTNPTPTNPAPTNPTTPILGVVSPESARGIASNISDGLPGCVFNAGGNGLATRESVSNANPIIQVLYKKTFQLISDQAKKSVKNSGRLQARNVDVNDMEVGDCPTDPGTSTTVGTKDDVTGSSIVKIDLNNFCTGTDAENTRVTGTWFINVTNELNSDSDEVPVAAMINTGPEGIENIEKTAEGTFVSNVILENFIFNAGNGIDLPTQGDQNLMAVDRIEVLDGRQNETFRAFNINMTDYMEPGMIRVMSINSFTFEDPDFGRFDIRTSVQAPLRFNENNEYLSGDFVLSGENGGSAFINQSPSVSQSVDLIVNGENQGLMDCSEIGQGEDIMM